MNPLFTENLYMNSIDGIRNIHKPNIINIIKLYIYRERERGLTWKRRRREKAGTRDGERIDRDQKGRNSLNP